MVMGSLFVVMEVGRFKKINWTDLRKFYFVSIGVLTLKK